MTTKPKGVQAYPLKWPAGVPRTKTRTRSKFKPRTILAAVDLLRTELKRMGAENIVISSHVPVRQDGNPYSDPGRMKDPGVAVYFQLDGVSYCFPCDRWIDVEENIHAVTKYTEAKRLMATWGVGSTSQEFAGFKALGQGEMWWEVLGLGATADSDQIQARYRTLAATAHPDKPGGSVGAMMRLNVARDQAIESLGGADGVS